VVQGQADHQVARVAFVADLGNAGREESGAQDFWGSCSQRHRKLAGAVSAQREHIAAVEFVHQLGGEALVRTPHYRLGARIVVAGNPLQVRLHGLIMASV
jgi:hypothetical protein